MNAVSVPFHVSGSIQSLLMRPRSLQIEPPGLLVQAGQHRRVALTLDGRFRIAQELIVEIVEDGVLDGHMGMSLQRLRVVIVQEQPLVVQEFVRPSFPAVELGHNKSHPAWPTPG